LGVRPLNWVHIFPWGVKWCEVYKQSACLLFNKIIRFLLFFVQQDLQNMPLGKLSFFVYVISRKRRAPQRKKLQSNVSQVKRSPHAKIQLFLSTFKMAKKSRGHSCLWPFIWLPELYDARSL